MADVPGHGYVDVNACFGPDHGMAASADAPLATLVAERRSHGIRLSLAASLVAATVDSLTGNRLAYEAAADAANGLAAIAVVGARRSGERSQVVSAAEAAGVVGYRLADGLAAAVASEAVAAELRAVARTGKPLLVPLSGGGPLNGFGEASAIGAATARLGIPVVLLGAHYNHIVDDLAAAVRFPHLHLDTSALAHFRAVETAVSAIGAERVLLGTGSPRRAAASPINAVLSAAIPDDAKRAILAGNAERLFGLAASAAGALDLSPLPTTARAFDVHTHFGPFDFDVPDVPDADLLGSLELPPTGAAIASAAVAVFGDPARGNAQAARAARADGGRQLAYVVADPADLAFTRDQLGRHLGRPGVAGVKIHGQFSGVSTATRAMADLFELLARNGRPVKIHNDGPGWDDALLELARRHPRLPIIVAHAGLGTPSAAAGRLAASTDNVYIELSSSFAGLAEVRRAVALTPPERLLWGSDAPLLDPAWVLGTYADAGIPPEHDERVFWSNAAELFLS